MTRASLPNRRPGVAIEFQHGAIAYRGMASFDLTTGEPREIFLDGGKVGSEVQASARDGAVLASLAIQHGTPLETLAKALTRLDDGTAAGPIGKFLDELRAMT